MAAKIVSTIAARNFGFVKAVTDPNGPDRIHLANLFGLADGIATGTSPEGQVFTGLAGQFQVDQLDVKNPDKILNTLQAGRLFFPTGIGSEIITAALGMRDDAKSDGALKVLRFAFAVRAFRANNPAGYSWEFEPLMEASPDSPMEAFKRDVQGKALPSAEKAKELEHKPQLAEGDAPEHEAAEGRKSHDRKR